MERHRVIQTVLDLYEAPSYLEVGVQDGLTFHAVQAPRKVAVDPVFRFDVEAMHAVAGATRVDYHQVPSDEYFGGRAMAEPFDVIYLDGLHTFDQTLRDFLNAITWLAPGGTIVIDDTLPNSYAAGLPSEEMSGRLRAATEPGNHAWMGDVYRLVYFIRDYLQQYSFATITENHGQTLVWREGRAAPITPSTVEAITRLEFSAMRLTLDQMKPLPLMEIVGHLARRRRLNGLTSRTP